MSEKLFPRLSRRYLLKSTGAIAAAAALAGCGSDGSDEEMIYIGNGENGTAVLPETTKYVLCRNQCSNYCLLEATVRGDKIVRIKRAPMGRLADPYHDGGPSGLREPGYYDRACLRGYAALQRMYTTDRIMTPLIREGERGKPESFRSATWDEAMSLVANKIKNVIDNDGRKAVSFAVGGLAAGVNGIWPYRRMSANLGATLYNSNFDMTMSAGLPRVIGWDSYPYLGANEAADHMRANTIAFWAYNPAETHVQSWHMFMDAKDSVKRNKIKAKVYDEFNYNLTDEATFVSIDTLFTTTASKSDYHLSPKPGSDGAIALAMIRELIYNHDNWLDKDFMVRNTVAPLFVRSDTKDFARISTLTSGTNYDDKYLARVSGTTKQSAAVANNHNHLAASFAGGAKTSFSSINATDFDLEYTGTETVSNDDSTTSTVTVSTAFKLLKDHVNQYTLAWCEGKTGIKPAVIQELVTQLCSPSARPVMFCTGFGLDHYYNGHHAYMAIATLAALTGNMGRAGAGAGVFLPNTALSYNGLPQTNPMGPAALPYLQLEKVLTTGLYNGSPYPIKLYWSAGGNPVSNMVGQKKFIQNIVGKLDETGAMIVCSEMNLTDTALYSDVVFPVSFWYESEDVADFGNHPYVTISEKCAEPMGSSMSDWNITKLLSKKLAELGVTDLGGNELHQFSDFTQEEYVEGRIMGTSGPNAAAIAGTVYPTGIFEKDYSGSSTVIPITSAGLRARKAIRTRSNKANNGPFIYNELDNDGVSGKYAVDGTVSVQTITRRFEFYNENSSIDRLLERHMLADTDDKARLDRSLEYLPSWEEPHEALDESKGEFAYMQEHNRWRVHTQWHHVEWILELCGEATVMMNPADAASKGINDGELVRVYSDNDRGEGGGFVILKAFTSHKVRPGQINIPKGYQRKQFLEHAGNSGFAGTDAGGYQELTHKAYHPVCVNQVFYDNRVNIEKL
jgi:molybdopterin-containing oxidoreductase family molybdopterin binding subunit